MEPALLAKLITEAKELLKVLIKTPSFSKEEEGTALIIDSFLQNKGIHTQRRHNNIWCTNKYFDPKKKTILLNSHHDTVRPNSAYTLDPFEPIVADGKLFGLGSNDAGASLVSLLVTFLYFYEKKDVGCNFIFLASAEEEISGLQGVSSILNDLPEIDLAIVGEPTQMNLAVAEKGLLVIDCTNKGIAGHAARNEGENAIYKSLKDIEWFRTFEFEKVSPTLGKVNMNVTLINSGTQHNIVPAECVFTADIRTTDKYTHEEILTLIKSNVAAEIKPRSLRLQSSGIANDHPIVKAAKKTGLNCSGSPTLSDQALMPFDSVKIGPGDSARSHTADEFVYLHEIDEGIKTYIHLLENYYHEKTLGKRKTTNTAMAD